MKIKLFLIKVIPVVLVLTMGRAFADCEFIVNNYGSTDINVEAGFYSGKSNKFTVRVAGQNSVKIKSDYSCDSKSNAGFGVVYINLIGGKSKGGWIYSPEANMFRGVGVSIGNNEGVKGLAPNGSNLILYNNYTPKSNIFEVKVEKADRNISRQFGSMN